MPTKLTAERDNDSIKATGICTPKQDKTPQKVRVPPKRVLPIIFLPGIMGSNLRLKTKRQDDLGKSNNIAWRPDRTGEVLILVNASPARRQLQLDPDMTEVDVYGGQASPTGDPSESAEKRHKVDAGRVHINVCEQSPVLTDDVIGDPNFRTKDQKAMERGWGEIFYGSYRKILETCEENLNSRFMSFWNSIIDRDPAEWGAHPTPAALPLSKTDFNKAFNSCWFPVHAMGYNWLRSNRDSADDLSGRILELMSKYKSKGYQCEKVILVTHSMGGLVARALIHPEMGGLANKVLGIVHGVMPATGAPAAYKRMRCGFEENLGGFDPAPKVLGNYGSEVTAVLGNSQGGLELLPSCAYGNGWLEIRQNGVLIKSLPEKGDPYNEIYMVRDKWFKLIREEWLNPARLERRNLENTCALLRKAKKFHDDIKSVYHENSYAHYSADVSRPSWAGVVWNLDKKFKGEDWRTFRILSDTKQGRLRIFKSEKDALEGEFSEDIYSPEGIIISAAPKPSGFDVLLGNSVGPGDQTVPLRSAEDQLSSGKFKGIFRQFGYEHQASYVNSEAISSTLYGIIKIAGNMKWGKEDKA